MSVPIPQFIPPPPGKALCAHPSGRLGKDHGIHMVHTFPKEGNPSLHPYMCLSKACVGRPEW